MFFHNQKVYNKNSAQVILPILFKNLKISSVLDIGCGIGTWLSVAKDLGIENVLGVDGEYVDSSLLLQNLNEDEFLAHDLSFPFLLDLKFDLLICLEVAEHLRESCADTLISSLIVHSDIILFSAAIPFQGGQNHLNEQPPQYWIEKFQTHGYKVYDPIRSEVWENPKVDVWYKQNIFLFSKTLLQLPQPIFTYMVNPELYQIQVTEKLKYQNELNRIKSGYAKPSFYLKRFLKCLLG